MRPWVKAGLAISAAAAILLIAYRSISGTPVPAYRAAKMQVKERLVAMGRVLPAARINVGSLVPGNVVKVHFDEGDAVGEGDLLIELDDREASAAVKQARASLNQAQARLELMRSVQRRVFDDELRQAEVALKRAELDFDRKKGLFDASAIPRANLEDASNALESAKSRKVSAEAKVTSSGLAGADYRSALAAVNQSEASLELAKARLEHTRIAAQADGVVLDRNVEPGDMVQAGKTLMVLVQKGRTRLVVQAEEKNLSRLKIGQKALASAEAYPDRTFPAAVSSIAPGIDPQRGTVEIRLSVSDPPDYLRSDMTVSVDIETGESASALVVPVEALHDPQSVEPWVFLARDGRAERRPVRLGIRGQSMVEIVSGLSEGDLVILPGPIVGPGQKVWPIPAKAR